MRDVNPKPAENALLLELKNFGIGIGAAMDVVGPD